MVDLKNKDKSIVQIIDYLFTNMDSSKISDIDFWEADSFAIGLMYFDKLVYLSTYQYKHDGIELCYAEFENIDSETHKPLSRVNTYEGISKEQLSIEIKGFFGLSQ